jgi:hypothetical protein
LKCSCSVDSNGDNRKIKNKTLEEEEETEEKRKERKKKKDG